MSGEYACRLCRHAQLEHNPIQGCPYCWCAATPGEASAQTEQEMHFTVIPAGEFLKGYEPTTRWRYSDGKTAQGTPCSSCGMTYADCTNKIFQKGGRACCGRCAYTSTHEEKEVKESRAVAATPPLGEDSVTISLGGEVYLYTDAAGSPGLSAGMSALQRAVAVTRLRTLADLLEAEA